MVETVTIPSGQDLQLPENETLSPYIIHGTGSFPAQTEGTSAEIFIPPAYVDKQMCCSDKEITDQTSEEGTAESCMISYYKNHRAMYFELWVMVV